MATAAVQAVSPRYRQIAEHLRRRIEQGQFAPGMQLPLEVALAREYGVNRLTLRKGLNLLAREQLICRERGKGTFVRGRADGTGTRVKIAYLGDYEAHLHRDFYLALVAAGQPLGVEVVAHHPAHDGSFAAFAERLRELAASTTVVVINSGQWQEARERWPEEMAELSLPFARAVHFHALCGEADTAPGCHVWLDQERAVATAVEHLLALGHRRFAWIGTAPLDHQDPLSEPDPAEPLFRSFRATLAAHGIGEWRAHAMWGDEGEAEVCYERFLEDCGDWPTAIVCNQDYRAMLCHHAATRLGRRIPARLSMVSIGDTPWSTAVRPRLTTVSLREAHAAQLAVRFAAAPWSPADEVLTFRVQPALVVRDSSCPPPLTST